MCLLPDYCFLSYRDLNADFIRRNGIRAILLDIDNTLEPYENPKPTGELCAWFTMLKENGVSVAFVSNNNAERVNLFNEELQFLAFSNAKKPFKKYILKALDALGASASEAIFMGDQILTDVAAAHNAGIRAILVPPIRDKKDILTKTKRMLERPILRKYRKEHPESNECEIWTRWKL